MADKELSSAGHKLGQLIGDWYEEYFALPLLKKVASHLKLYLDHRFRKRASRESDRIIWMDDDGNAVNCDFVMEVDGSDSLRGVPVGFFECFWRRGSRHSRDKARDDSGKLMPLRDTYPSARFLGIVAGGDFTSPARALLQSRRIDLLYVPKAKIIAAFESHGLQMDYPDKLVETEKSKLAETFEQGLTAGIKRKAAASLRKMVGETTLNTYVDRVRAALGALPQEIRVRSQKQSNAAIFESVAAATEFLDEPTFDFSAPTENFIYEITYSDGSDFERQVSTLDELRALHHAIERLTEHVTSLTRFNDV